MPAYKSVVRNRRSAKSAAFAKAAGPSKKTKPVAPVKDDSPKAVSERRKALPPQKKNKVKQSLYKIRVIKRLGGTTRFAKQVYSLRKQEKRWREHVKKLKATKKDADGKVIVEAVQPPKFEIKRMKNFYHTQLAPRSLPAKDTFKVKSERSRITRLKKNITPGTVCILLAGKYKGSRVVFLKQLKHSGLCLVTGPFSVNKVPLRRMNQNYMIGTSVRVNVEGVKVPKHINDAYFKREKTPKKKKSEDEEIFKSKKKVKKGPKAQKKLDQKAMDRAIVGAIKKGENTKMILKYLKAKFAVMGRRYPHDIKF